jgi:hypothetical protein
MNDYFMNDTKKLEQMAVDKIMNSRYRAGAQSGVGMLNEAIQRRGQDMLGMREADAFGLNKDKFALDKQKFGLEEKEFGAKYGGINATGLSQLLAEGKGGRGISPRDVTDLIEYFWRNK